MKLDNITLKEAETLKIDICDIMGNECDIDCHDCPAEENCSLCDLRGVLEILGTWVPDFPDFFDTVSEHTRINNRYEPSKREIMEMLISADDISIGSADVSKISSCEIYLHVYPFSNAYHIVFMLSIDGNDYRELKTFNTLHDLTQYLKNESISGINDTAYNYTREYENEYISELVGKAFIEYSLNEFGNAEPLDDVKKDLLSGDGVGLAYSELYNGEPVQYTAFINPETGAGHVTIEIINGDEVLNKYIDFDDIADMVNYINMFDFDDAIAEAQSIIGGDEPEPVPIDNLLKARDKAIELLETINAEIDARRGPVYNETDELTQIIKNYFGV